MVAHRTSVDPWTWSAQWGYAQGELVTGAERTLHCSGQAAMGADGRPLHAGDMASQLALALDNVEAVLGAAGMGLPDLVRLDVVTTDVELLLQHYGVLAARLGAAGVVPTTTMLGVQRLVLPELLVELVATAVA